MSTSESTPLRRKIKQKKGKATRIPSASEIAKNSHQFEIWCTYQNLERAAYEDIPESFKKDVEDVFNVSKRLPRSWVEKDTPGYKLLSSIAPPEFIAFIAKAYDEEPSLFGTEVKDEDFPSLYLALTKPFTAWKHVGIMLDSNEKWSEADFADIYAAFRRPAIGKSTCRMQCSISLPQPPLTTMGAEAACILNARRSIPDCVVMIPPKAVRHLSESTRSPFKQLKQHSAVKKTGSSAKNTSFPYQATVRHSLPDIHTFEFVSSVWEDKKPVHSAPEHAYRQNRMSTASAARHLHSLHVDAPIFGLTWAYGEVRAHIDWCKRLRQEDHPIVYSAPYTESSEQEYCKWNLGRASDILHLHFLIVNIDQWTTGEFLKRVVGGVTALERSVVKDKQPFEPWRRSDDIRPRRSLTPMENAELSANILSSTPPKPKRKPAKSRAVG